MTRSGDWAAEIAASFVEVDSLLDFLGIQEVSAVSATIRNVIEGAPMKVPRSFALRMERGDPADPLLRQVLPRPEEAAAVNGFSSDPVGDECAAVIPGVLKKYEGRVLVIATGACAMSCRFCFRRQTLRRGQVRPAPDPGLIERTVRAMPDVDEVILSGGDPLMLSNEALGELLVGVSSVPHVQRIRLHSRMVTVVPSRVDEGLISIVRRVSKPVIVVTHVNHPNELDRETAEAVAVLRRADVIMMNQSVLLKGVNDSMETLAGLSRKLISQGVTPYYLHQLDRTCGTHHFEVTEERGRALIEAMRSTCAGYMVPRYVREESGAPSKTLLT